MHVHKNNHDKNYLLGYSGTDSLRRIVRVFISDPDRDLPVKDCMLYFGNEKLTDETDAEIFLGLDIPKLLAAHNTVRRKHKLEPVRYRNLVMSVATIVGI